MTIHDDLRNAFAELEAVKQKARTMGWPDEEIEMVPRDARWILRVGGAEVYEAGVVFRGGNTPGDGQPSIDVVVSRAVGVIAERR